MADLGSIDDQEPLLVHPKPIRATSADLLERSIQRHDPEALPESGMCWICFEDDSPENMFQPCRCDGTNRWVHRDCLDTWRATAPNSEAFDHCMTCGYKYELEYKEPELSWIGRINRAMAQNTCFLCLFILMAILTGGLAIRAMDENQVIYRVFRDHIYHEKPDKNGRYSGNNEYFYYYVFTSYIYLLLVGVMYLFNILRMKNRLLYLKYCLGYDWFCGLLRLSTIAILTGLTFYLNIYLGCFILTLEIQTIIRMHYIYLHYLFRANRNRVLPYDRSKDNLTVHVV